MQDAPIDVDLIRWGLLDVLITTRPEMLEIRLDVAYHCYEHI